MELTGMPTGAGGVINQITHLLTLRAIVYHCGFNRLHHLFTSQCLESSRPPTTVHTRDVVQHHLRGIFSVNHINHSVCMFVSMYECVVAVHLHTVAVCVL